MNSARSSTQSGANAPPPSSRRCPSLKPNFIQLVKQRVGKKIANKYSTCENYLVISEINRTLMNKQCILKTTLNDLAFDRQNEKFQLYYPIKMSMNELPELIEYYKYYSQKTMLYMKEFFPLLYQHQEKRKVVEYHRLKALLNLSDSRKEESSANDDKNSDANSAMPNRSRIGISRNLNSDDPKHKDFFSSKILDQLSLSNFSTKNDSEESLLINRLRNNLSKHIGPSHSKNMSIEELDKFFDFQNKKKIFKPFKDLKEQNFMNFTKTKLNSAKPKKVQRERTTTNLPDESKSKGTILRRSAKRNNSCENLIRISISKNPYEAITSKIKRKKNLSMDNMCTNTSTPYILEERKESAKMRKIPTPKGGDRYQREKQNTHGSKMPQKFADTISDLKLKIQKQKERIIKASYGGSYASLKREKPSYTSINTANQRFSNKNYTRLREKTINAI